MNETVGGVLSTVTPAAMMPSCPVLVAMSRTASSARVRLTVPLLQLETVIV